MKQNARFWELVNHDWVKITLKEGHRLSWSKYSRTDEGFDSWAVTWEHLGEMVLYRSAHFAQDCDGRLDRFWDAECELTQLRARSLPAPFFGDDRTEFEKALLLPFWKEIDCHQRDYSAESMGY